MASNFRIYYPIHVPGFSKLGLNTFTPAHGVQSVGINTNFNLEQVFELGQISIYENIEQIPDVEVTVEKVMDGYPPVYLLATNGASSASLAGRSTIRTTMALSIYSDAQDSSSGTPLSQAVCSGLYVSQINYSFPVEGNCTESVTFVGNNKIWLTGVYGPSYTFTPTFNNLDEPLAIAGSGGVNRREDVLMGSAASLWPTEIPGISTSGTNDLVLGVFNAHIQNVRVSTNLGREELFELGSRGPYYRFATFPTEVRTEIELTSTLGDRISADETSSANLANQTIKIKLREGLVLDLGSRNKLSAVAYAGGNAGQNGGNVTDQYTYVNFNDMTVQHPNDPSTALRP